MMSGVSPMRDAQQIGAGRTWRKAVRNPAVMRLQNIDPIDESANDAMPLKLIDLIFPEAEDDHIRIRAWQELTASLFVTNKTDTTLSSRDLFFRCYHLGRMLFFDQRACAHHAERTLSQIVTQGVDHIVIALQMSGATRMISRDGEVAAKSGDFFVLDLAQGFQLATEGMSAIQICIPRRRIEKQAGNMGVLHANVLPSSGNPLLKLMADHLMNMRACLSRTDAEQRSHLTSAALAICNAVLTCGSAGTRDDPMPAAIEIRQFIEDNLQRPELGIELLRVRFGLSRTPLYKLFDADGGVANYIRNRRLAHAMRLLAGVEGRPRQRVSSVAYACGYQSEKIFSRAFRHRYGINPRDVDQTFPRAAVPEKGALLASWLQNL